MHSKNSVLAHVLVGMLLCGAGIGCHSSRTSQKKTVLSEKAKAQLAQQVLTEMMQVIYSREGVPAAEYQEWLNVLYQGASLEGVYRGMVLSREYRKLETDGPVASTDAQSVFMREAKDLGLELSGTPNPPLERVSVYALKKRLADFALQKMDSFQKQSPNSETNRALREWFARWAAQKASQGVDFGVRERMSTDPVAIAKGMENLSDDRLRWEVLTRLHRMMNQAQTKGAERK